MTGWILDVMSACAHFMWDMLGLLLRGMMGLVSTAASVISWPFKAMLNLLGCTLQWTPLFMSVLTLLGVLIAGITVLALVSRWRRRIK